MALYFVSDMHLDDEKPGLQQAFFALLDNRQSEIEALYLLGDLFEYWIGDDHLSPQTSAFIQRIRALTDAGIPCYLQHGNRDFLLGRHFLALTGMTLLPDTHRLRLGKHNLVLCHGDQLCTDDHQYQRSRYWLRQRWVKGLLRRLPLQMRLRIANRARTYSQGYNQNQQANILDVTDTAVVSLLDQTGATTVIHGHTHRPAEHLLPNGRKRIVLGSWSDQGGAIATLTQNDLVLEHFHI